MSNANLNSRKRNWFITVNAGAECYNDFENILFRFCNNGKADYAFIQHTPEVKKDLDGNVIEKPFHYHAVLVCENPRFFSSIAKSFRGAHIEPCFSLSSVSEYLLHITPKAIKDGKKTYSIDEIKSSNPTAFKQWIGSAGIRREVFDENKISDYVWFDGLETVTEFYERFGVVVMKYIPLIKQIIDDFHGETYNSFIHNLKNLKLDSANYSCYVREVLSFKNFKINGFEMLFKYKHWEKLDEDFYMYLKEYHSDFLVSHGLTDIENLSIDFVRSALLLQEEQIL